MLKTNRKWSFIVIGSELFNHMSSFSEKMLTVMTVLMRAKLVEINLPVARNTHLSDHKTIDTNCFIVT